MVTPPAGFSAIDALGPFAAHVGPFYIRDGAEHGPVLGLRAVDEHANSAGAIHGGLLATLCDLALGYAVRAQADDDIAAAVTVSLTTDFLAAAEPGAWLEARAKVEKLGGRLAFADCSVTADEREVVRARAVFSVLD
ncbi:MAG: hypothetical protein QOE31_2349 [Solirubrobacteraceae bacterium]|jgi:uncharacterized protein (TIGR00369 family)|nr:hypothetical protein [Solirubrobacteraceae bacterium]